MSTKKEQAVGLSLQIVYEYENWGDEHVSDMIQTYKDCGDPAPCTGDMLLHLCEIAESHKSTGKSYQETKALMMKKGK